MVARMPPAAGGMQLARSRGTGYPRGVPPLQLPPSDEPFDFRHQAADYACYRRDYSPALYDAIVTHAGQGEGRLALDLGCGTGFVTAALRCRGWTAVGVDFSAPMLAEARRLTGGALVRACGEAIPVRDEAAALITCGTAFHWFRPRPTLAEMARALAPGGWAALFWRYPAPGEASAELIAEVLGRFGVELPGEPVYVHPEEPFAGSGLVPEPVRVLESVLEYTAEHFHGHVATVEYLRRLSGAHHAAFLTALRAELLRRHPRGFRERNEEYLFLARRSWATPPGPIQSSRR